jgi:1-acyl-sn-glycerol-3-phosphate acyltransferase
MRRLLLAMYGVPAWGVFFVLSIVTLVLLLIVPTLPIRRRLTRRVARTVLALTAHPLRVDGLERLPRGQCVVVANHASYIDGVVLKAALPPRFSFVIKKEMSRVPLAGLLLRRIGSHFVERADPRAGASDARRLVRSATAGTSLAVFPEGTFSEQVGVGRFHNGAFTAAARAGLPVVPVVIRGARAALPCGALLPRPGLIRVDILAPIATEATDDRARVRELRDAARTVILEHLGEPDLDSAATCSDDNDHRPNRGRG